MKRKTSYILFTVLSLFLMSYKGVQPYHIHHSLVFKTNNSNKYICRTFDYNLMDFSIYIDDYQLDSSGHMSIHGFVYRNQQLVADKSIYSCKTEKDTVYILDLLAISDKNGEFHVNNFAYKNLALLIENNDSSAIVTGFYPGIEK